MTLDVNQQGDDPSTEVLTGNRRAAAIRTAFTGDIPVAATGVNCIDDTCKQPDGSGGCAACVDLTIYLPLGAQVHGIRYFSTAGGPAGDVPMRQVTPGDFAWSLMEAAQVTSTSTNVVVKAKYHNRSHNRARAVKLEVDWS